MQKGDHPSYTKSHSQQITFFGQEQSPLTLPFPNQQRLYQQISRSIGLTSPLQKKQLKMSINSHYKKHLSVIEAQQQRLMRFAQGHERGQHSKQQKNQIKKATIALKQQKALANKKQEMLARSKKAQESLIVWKGRVRRQKEEDIQKEQRSARALQHWEEKTQSCNSRKSMRLRQISENMRESTKRLDSQRHSRKNTENLTESKSLRKHTRSPYSNAFASASRTLNPQNQSTILKADSTLEVGQRHHRNGSKNRNGSKELLSQSKSFARVTSKDRISTESVMKRQQQLREAELQKCLFETRQKSRKIQQARQIKIYLEQQRQNQIRQRQSKSKLLQKQHANQERIKVKIRNQDLNRKHRQDRTRMRDISLPTIHGVRSLEGTLESGRDGGEGHEMAGKDYQKEIVLKIRKISIIMSKYLQR